MLDFNKLKEEQLKLAKKVVTRDSFEKLELIGGVDCAFNQIDVIAAIVVCDYKTMEMKEKVFAVVKAKVPYIKGFLAYREGHAISEAYAKLENKPDVLIFDGNGILHPRRCGLASHIGILLDQPSIGIAKQLLIGEVKGNVVYVDMSVNRKAISAEMSEREHRSELSHVTAQKPKVFDKEARAELVMTREHSKPVYVSPGHKISLKTSVEIVKNCMIFPHKLPEPLHLAHRYANEIREKIVKGELKG